MLEAQEEAYLEKEATAKQAAFVKHSRRERAMSMSTLVAAVDAAIGRDADDEGQYFMASAFAVAWAALGYVVWLTIVITARVVHAIWRWISSRGRKG